MWLLPLILMGFFALVRVFCYCIRHTLCSVYRQGQIELPMCGSHARSEEYCARLATSLSPSFSHARSAPGCNNDHRSYLGRSCFDPPRAHLSLRKPDEAAPSFLSIYLILTFLHQYLLYHPCSCEGLPYFLSVPAERVTFCLEGNT